MIGAKPRKELANLAAGAILVEAWDTKATCSAFRDFWAGTYNRPCRELRAPPIAATLTKNRSATLLRSDIDFDFYVKIKAILP